MKVAYKPQHIIGRGGIGLVGQTITLYTVVCMRHFTEVVQAVCVYCTCVVRLHYDIGIYLSELSSRQLI